MIHNKQIDISLNKKGMIAGVVQAILENSLTVEKEGYDYNLYANLDKCKTWAEMAKWAREELRGWGGWEGTSCSNLYRGIESGEGKTGSNRTKPPKK